MTDYVLSVLQGILARLQECNEDLMTLEAEVSSSEWNDLSDAFEGIEEAVETLEWVLKGREA